MSIDVMKQALEVLNTGGNEVLPEDYGQMVSEAITALRAAIEQAPNYTTPQWQDLTGEEIADLITAHAGFPLRLTEAVEAKLKEKNT